MKNGLKLIAVTRNDIAEEAESWLKTPYLHQAMIKGKDGGVDCAMLIAGVAINLGIMDESIKKDIPAYPMDWHFHNDVPLMTDIMEIFGCKKRKIKSLASLNIGDIVTFKLGRVPSHLGIYVGDNFFIHAYGGVKTVVKNELSAQWADRFHSAYRYPGVK